jgi:hypothetical protein
MRDYPANLMLVDMFVDTRFATPGTNVNAVNPANARGAATSLPRLAMKSIRTYRLDRQATEAT